jgi:hypothetical protein
MRLAAAVLLAVIAPAASVFANDSSAVLGAGGLELTVSRDIAMESEDLYISHSQIRVRYAFRNDSERNVTTKVAFPLPEIDLREQAELLLLPHLDQSNFVDFHVTVDGRSVEPKLEEKAIDAKGGDVTEAIVRAGLPVNGNDPAWKAKTAALSRAVRQQLADKGLISVETEDAGKGAVETAYPNWSLRATYYWDQTFPAGKIVIVEHRYEPIVGASPVGSRIDFSQYKDFCLDDQGRAAVQRLLKAQAASAPAGAPADSGAARVFAYEVDYVLTTGANWKAPIGRFNLTIDKEKPDAVLTLCIDDIKKTGPTTFEAARTDFTPRKDIRFVVLSLEKSGG